MYFYLQDGRRAFAARSHRFASGLKQNSESNLGLGKYKITPAEILADDSSARLLRFRNEIMSFTAIGLEVNLMNRKHYRFKTKTMQVAVQCFVISLTQESFGRYQGEEI